MGLVWYFDDLKAMANEKPDLDAESRRLQRSRLPGFSWAPPWAKFGPIHGATQFSEETKRKEGSDHQEAHWVFEQIVDRGLNEKQEKSLERRSA
jgi:hypothetical protein